MLLSSTRRTLIGGTELSISNFCIAGSGDLDSISWCHFLDDGLSGLDLLAERDRPFSGGCANDITDWARGDVPLWFMGSVSDRTGLGRGGAAGISSEFARDLDVVESRRDLSDLECASGAGLASDAFTAPVGILDDGALMAGAQVCWRSIFGLCSLCRRLASMNDDGGTWPELETDVERE